MSALHHSLADLARDHGTELFRDATAFRGSLDDYLDEGQASSGTINLLTDAVRLGALDGMLTMLSSGASADNAVDSAGQRLARDRGSADIRGCQWALAVLGFALGRVPETLVLSLAPGGSTPMGSMPGAMQAAPPPPPAAMPTFPAAPPAPPAYPTYAAPTGHPAPGWQQPAPPKSRTGLLIGSIAVGLVMLVVVIVGIVVILKANDDSPAADAPASDTPSADASSGDTESTDAPTDETDVPDIGGSTFTGTGYHGQLPKGWVDATADFAADNADVNTLDRMFVWGDSFQTARANVIIEVQSAFGSTDPNDLKDDWIEALTGGVSDAEYQDIDPTTIAGEHAIGIDVSRTNDDGRAISQRAYLVIHGDNAYALGASMVVGDDDVLTALTDILSTWQWD